MIFIHSYSGGSARMPSLAEFNAQLERCAQSAEEVRDFVEAFTKLLTPLHRPRHGGTPSTGRQPDTARIRRAVAGSRVSELERSRETCGIRADACAGGSEHGPFRRLAACRRCHGPGFPFESDGLYRGHLPFGEAERRVIPGADACVVLGAAVADQRRAEVPRLNAWLAWSRAEGISPARFGDYQKHVRIHGASQNAGGAVGAAGASIAILDAIQETVPGISLSLLGGLPPPGQRDPVSVEHIPKTARHRAREQ